MFDKLQWERDKRAKNKMNNLCIDCSKPKGMSRSKVKCSVCYEKRLKEVRDLRERHIKEHLCTMCGEPNDTRLKRCSRCSTKILERRKELEDSHKLTVFQRISGREKPTCGNCRCDDMRALELNHKNGGGRQDYMKHRTKDIINAIYYGRRKAEDFSLLCRVCNTLEYATRKWGGLKWAVTYIGPDQAFQ